MYIMSIIKRIEKVKEYFPITIENTPTQWTSPNASIKVINPITIEIIRSDIDNSGYCIYNVNIANIFIINTIIENEIDDMIIVNRGIVITHFTKSNFPQIFIPEYANFVIMIKYTKLHVVDTIKLVVGHLNPFNPDYELFGVFEKILIRDIPINAVGASNECIITNFPIYPINSIEYSFKNTSDNNLNIVAELNVECIIKNGIIEFPKLIQLRTIKDAKLKFTFTKKYNSDALIIKFNCVNILGCTKCSLVELYST
jgi:hypothetical protein